MDEIRLGTRTIQPGRQLLVNGRREPIGKRALDILSVLAEAGGGIVTKDELLDAVWPGVTVEENALQVHIVALRKALGPEAERLQTIRGVGYQLDVDGEAAPTAEVFARETSILVLPFDNMSADPEQEYFADGITEDIITDLSRASALRVIPRGSAFAFKGKFTNVAEVARQLDVSHVLQGSVRRSGDRLRVSAQLVDGISQDHVWAERYDRSIADIFDLQDELTRAIVNALKVSLLPSERRGVGTTSFEAYDLYIQARALWATLQADNVRRASDVYRQALQLDPDFASAWAGLAGSLLQSFWLFPDTPIEPQEIDEALAKALELAPDSPEATASRAEKCLFAHDWAGAAECMAFFNGRQDTSWTVSGQILLALGRAQDAAEQQIKVRRTDPLSPRANWALQVHLDCAGRLAEAEAEFEHSRNLTGLRPAMNWEATKRMIALGDHAAARDRFIAWFGDDAERYPFAPALSRALDNPKEAQEILRTSFLDPSNHTLLRLDAIAHWASHFGDDELALRGLVTAVDNAQGMSVIRLWHPNFARVRQDARFKDILRDLGLVDHWRKTGNWGDFVRPVGNDDFEVIA